MACIQQRAVVRGGDCEKVQSTGFADGFLMGEGKKRKNQGQESASWENGEAGLGGKDSEFSFVNVESVVPVGH